MRPVARKLVEGVSYGFRPATGPLQAVRVEVSVVWFGALLLAAMLYDNPPALVAVLAGVVGVAVLSSAGRPMRFTLLFGLPIALTAAIINPIVTREGLTVVIEGAWLPLIGSFDVTQEAIVYGLILGLRAVTVVAIAALYVAVVDPDAVLRMLRRFSVRSAIAATLAARLVPLLARDSLNLAAARDCRPGPDPGTLAVTRSVFARSFERAEDAALALELRGYAHAKRRRPQRRRFARAELVVLAAAALLTLLAIGGKLLGLLGIDPYPVTVIDLGAADLALALALCAAIVAPIAALRGLR